MMLRTPPDPTSHFTESINLSIFWIAWSSVHRFIILSPSIYLSIHSSLYPTSHNTCLPYSSIHPLILYPSIHLSFSFFLSVCLSICLSLSSTCLLSVCSHMFNHMSTQHQKAVKYVHTKYEAVLPIGISSIDVLALRLAPWDTNSSAIGICNTGRSSCSPYPGFKKPRSWRMHPRSLRM